MLGPKAHVDTFARDHLPPPDQWPDFPTDTDLTVRSIDPAVGTTDRMVGGRFGNHSADRPWPASHLRGAC